MAVVEHPSSRSVILNSSKGEEIYANIKMSIFSTLSELFIAEVVDQSSDVVYGKMTYKLSDDRVQISSLDNSTHGKYEVSFPSGVEKVKGVGTVLIDWAYSYQKPVTLSAMYSSHGFYAKRGFTPPKVRRIFEDSRVRLTATRRRRKSWKTSVLEMLSKTGSTHELGCQPLISTPAGYEQSCARVEEMAKRVLTLPKAA